MPHVVVNGELEIKDIFNGLTPLFIRENSKIIKTTGFFLSKDNSSILVEAIVIDKGKVTDFLSMINKRDDGVVVRIYPKIDVEKTDLVKRTLAELAKEILSLFPRTSVGKTNLQEFL